MKASELRIGNYVHLEDMCTSNFHVLDEVPKQEDELYRWIEPIPLTEEWLLKFGFEKQHNEEDFDYWFKNDFSNDIIWEHSEGFCHNLNYGGDIKYVHQLQNLYFALTNEELTYEQQK